MADEDDFTVTGDEFDRCLDRAERAEAESERLRRALIRIRDRDWNPVMLTDGGKTIAQVAAPDFAVAQRIATDALGDKED